MKLLTLLACFLPLSLMAQVGTGPSVRMTNSSATGLTLLGTTLTPGGGSISSSGFSGNGSGLTNSQLASFTNSGAVTTNDFAFIQNSPEWQRTAELSPWRGNVSGDFASSTNIVGWMNRTGQKGYNIMIGFEQLFATTRTAGHLTCNLANFPLGWASYREFLHTNGWRFGMWYDSANATSEGYASLPQFIDDIQTILRDAQPDVLWVDETGYRAELANSIIRTNTRTVVTMYGVTSAAGVALDDKTISLGNSWRLHGPTDIASWDSFVIYCNMIESNGWMFVGPSRHPYVGPEASGIGTSTETYTGVALQAMWSANFLQGFLASADVTAGPYLLMTNANILDVQGDVLNQCARRVLTTNGCWWYLKPLADPKGSFAVCVVNTNAFTTNSLALFTALNDGCAASSFMLNATTYTVRNLRTDSNAGYKDIGITNTSLASHDFALFKLSPTVPEFVTNNTPATVSLGVPLLTLGLDTNMLQISKFGVSVGESITLAAIFEIQSKVSTFATNAMVIDQLFIGRRNKGTGLFEWDGLQTAATGFMWQTNGQPLVTFSGLLGNSFRHLTTFTNGFASKATNIIANAAISANGYTNNTGRNMVLNLNGTVVSYELYNAAGIGVVTNSGLTHDLIPLPSGAGVRITTFTGGTAAAYAQ